MLKCIVHTGRVPASTAGKQQGKDLNVGLLDSKSVSLTTLLLCHFVISTAEGTMVQSVGYTFANELLCILMPKFFPETLQVTEGNVSLEVLYNPKTACYKHKISLKSYI